MGRQAHFYVGPRDIETLTHQLRQKDVVIVPTANVINLSDTESFPVFESTRKVFLVREEDMPSIAWDTLGYVTQMDAPIVEYSGSFIKTWNGNRIMHSGRLWFAPATLTGQPKPAEFVRWADSLLRVARKLFPVCVGDPLRGRVGPEAAEMRATAKVVFDIDLISKRAR